MKTTEKATPATATKKLTLKEKSAALKAKNDAKNPTKVTKAEADKAIIKETVTKAVSQQREVKYIYPDDVITTDEKKKYRQSIRNKEKAFYKEIADLKKHNKPTVKAEAAFKKFRKEHYLVP